MLEVKSITLANLQIKTARSALMNISGLPRLPVRSLEASSSQGAVKDASQDILDWLQLTFGFQVRPRRATTYSGLVALIKFWEILDSLITTSGFCVASRESGTVRKVFI